MTLGENIRAIRKERGLLIRELGAMCDMDGGHISKIETGKLAPNAYLLKKIADALVVSIDELFDQSSDK